MKRSTIVMLALFTIACGGDEAASTLSEATAGAAEVSDAANAQQATVDRREMPSEAVCEILKSGVLDDVLVADEAGWSYRPASKSVPQALCTATAKSPDGSSSHEVSLMIMRSSFDSPEDAVTSLEGTVKSLSEGMTIEVAGKTYTKQVEFEPFLEGVGDQAAWAPKLSELSVADGGTRFAVTVLGAANGEENKALAIELAQRIGDAL